MNRMLVRLTGAAFAAAVLALSAPVLADGHRGGGGHSAGGQQSSGGGNRGGGHAGRSGGGESMRSSGGSRSSSGGSGRNFSNGGGSERSFGSGAPPRNFNNGGSGRTFSSGSMNNGGARFSGNVARPGNNGRSVEAPRFVEGSERAASSRFRPPASGNFVMGNAPRPAPIERNLSNSNLPNPTSGSRFQRAPGAITHGRFADSERNSFSDRHYGTPRVPGLPASGGRFNNFPNHSPGFGHRPSPRFWYGNRPFFGWNGGYWRGVYWPRAYYRPGFVGFVTLLPPVYSTFWYGGVSYYYANDLYYTWNPDRYGYVVSNPPPVADDTSGTYSTAPDADDQGSSGSGDLYVYPRNGQSEEQTAQDRYECHQWAVNQTGFDPTLGQEQASSAGTSEDYHRAIIACLDGRGYSAN